MRRILTIICAFILLQSGVLAADQGAFQHGRVFQRPNLSLEPDGYLRTQQAPNLQLDGAFERLAPGLLDRDPHGNLSPYINECLNNLQRTKFIVREEHFGIFNDATVSANIYISNHGKVELKPSELRTFELEKHTGQAITIMTSGQITSEVSITGGKIFKVHGEGRVWKISGWE